MDNFLPAQKYINQSREIFQMGHPNLTKALEWQQKIEKALEEKGE